MPAGQPTKFNEKIKKQIEFVAKKGFTDVEIAAAVGVTERTLNNWKKTHLQFFQSLKSWKAEADENIEKSLRQRALGYQYSEKTYTKNSDGEIVLTKEVTKEVAPDTTAQIFWLKNRKPGEWRDKQDVQVGGDLKVEIVKFARDKK